MKFEKKNRKFNHFEEALNAFEIATYFIFNCCKISTSKIPFAKIFNALTNFQYK